MCYSRLSPFARLRAMLDRRLYHVLLSMGYKRAKRPLATDIPKPNTSRSTTAASTLAAPYGTEQHVSDPTQREYHAFLGRTGTPTSKMATVYGCDGLLDIDYYGRVLTRTPAHDWMPTCYPEIDRFDVTEFMVWAHGVGHQHDGSIHLLDISYYTNWADATYIAADDMHRQVTAGLLCPRCAASTSKGDHHVCG